MKDNFDLKKFLTENNTLENSNPYLKEEMGEEMQEAKKDEEDEEDVDIEVDTDEDLEADIDLDNVEGEDTPDADMPKVEGDEGEILSNLMKALDIAKSLDDEKLINQIGNTVTFLTRQYISTTK